MPPVLYVIAGPNGIGKTSSDYDFVPINIPVINSDEIAAEIKRPPVTDLAHPFDTQKHPAIYSILNSRTRLLHVKMYGISSFIPMLNWFKF
jgi:predicted ABC-type ATPase